MLLFARNKLKRLGQKIVDAYFNVAVFLPFYKEKYSQIIICGVPRSGTSLTFNLVSKLAEGMTPKFPINKKPTKTSGYTKEMSGYAIITKPGNFITKLPNDIFNIEKIQNANVLNKKILFIITYRDFRDVLVSKHQWGNGEYYLTYDFKNSINGEKNFERGLKHYLTRINSLDQVILKERISVELLKYEQLVENPNILTDILEKHKFKNRGKDHWHDSIGSNSIYEHNEMSSMKVMKDKTKWRDEEHKDKILSEFKNNTDLLDALIKYGYEENDDWLNNCVDN